MIIRDTAPIPLSFGANGQVFHFIQAKSCESLIRHLAINHALRFKDEIPQYFLGLCRSAARQISAEIATEMIRTLGEQKAQDLLLLIDPETNLSALQLACWNAHVELVAVIVQLYDEKQRHDALRVLTSEGLSLPMLVCGALVRYSFYSH